ncbi:MAG: hypothetical protein AAF741_12415 [Bacteroidota bacterium]
MDIKQTKHELQHLISGKSGHSYDALIQTVANYLRSGQRASPMAEEKHQNKAQETERLLEFARQNELLIEHIDPDDFVSAGAEQRVYINQGKHVTKLNDAIYYASWEDYFHNLLLHNYFFADTAYNLIGFHYFEKNLYAVIQQAYVKADSLTDLNDVKSFMVANGFINLKRHDYRHPYLGIIVEDLHDENVLTQDGVLYFIDTVFFIDPEKFWS